MPSFSKVVRDPVSQAPDTVLTTGIQVAARQREVHLHIGEQAPSGSTTFPHTQSSPALEWLIPLTGSGQPTSVLVKNDAGEVIMARILEASASQVVIKHRVPTSGSAVVSKGA